MTPPARVILNLHCPCDLSSIHGLVVAVLYVFLFYRLHRYSMTLTVNVYLFALTAKLARPDFVISHKITRKNRLWVYIHLGGTRYHDEHHRRKWHRGALTSCVILATGFKFYAHRGTSSVASVYYGFRNMFPW